MLLGRGSKDSDSESNPALPKPEVSSEPSSLFPMHCLFPIWYLSFYFQQRLLPGLNHSHPDLKVSFQSLLTGWNPAPTDRPASWQGPLSRASKVPPPRPQPLSISGHKALPVSECRCSSTQLSPTLSPCSPLRFFHRFPLVPGSNMGAWSCPSTLP